MTRLPDVIVSEFLMVSDAPLCTIAPATLFTSKLLAMTLPIINCVVLPFNLMEPFPVIDPLLIRVPLTFNEDPVLVVILAPLAIVMLFTVADTEAAIEGE